MGFLCVVLACSHTPPADNADTVVDSARAAEDSLPNVIPMPALPEASPGRFALVTEAIKPEYRFRGDWAASAALCAPTRALQLFVYDPLFAVAVVAGIPDTDAVSGEYRVVSVRHGLPEPWTARVALQTYNTDRAYSLPGVGGTVTLDSLTDVVSGHLAVSVFENVFLDTVRVAAAFRSLPVEPAEGETCRVIGIPADSMRTR